MCLELKKLVKSEILRITFIANSSMARKIPLLRLLEVRIMPCDNWVYLHFLFIIIIIIIIIIQCL